MSLSVVIPTVGRQSLLKLVEEIIDDSKCAAIEVEIYVALNGVFNERTLLPEQVKILEISDKAIGVGRTMNEAVRMVPSGIVWTIADDENWLPGKFLHDLGIMNRDDAPDILSPIAILTDEVSSRIRPRKKIKNNDVASYLFSKFHFGANPTYLTLSGACAEKEVWLREQFPTDLLSREDIVYLLNQAKKLTTFSHGNVPTVKINISLERSAKRDTSNRDSIVWAKNNLNQNQISVFLGCIWPKPHVLTGNYKILLKMLAIQSKDVEISRKARVQISMSLIYWTMVALVFVSRSFMRDRKRG